MLAAPTGRTGNLLVGHMMSEFMCEDNIYTEECEGSWFVEGIFLQGDVLNNNKRVYPTTILDTSVDQYIQSRVSGKTAWGELGHPDSPKINLDKVAILTNELVKKGKDFYGKAKVCHEDCPMGKILRGLLKTGGRVGVSSRGLGTADKSKWQEEECDLVDHFVLRAIDVVADPSAPDAMVNAIEEEKVYILDDSNGEVTELNEESYKMFENQLRVLPVKSTDRTEKVFGAMKNFLNSLRANTK